MAKLTAPKQQDCESNSLRITAATEVLQRGNRLAERLLALVESLDVALEPVSRAPAPPNDPVCGTDDRVSPGYPALFGEVDSINDRVELASDRLEALLHRLEV